MIVVALTAGAYAALYFLEVNSVGPVVFRPADAQVVTQHAIPTVSIVGAISWMSVLLAYAATAGLLASTGSRARRLTLVLVIFAFSVVYVALIHPTLILTVLSSTDRERFTVWTREHASAIYQYYFGSPDFQRAILLLAALHAALVAVIVVAANRNASSRSEATIGSIA